ncbi:MAG: AmmeMemoRadiSam system radical SAM enzyme [Bacteroidales bacterium]|nr:AmmeMemoRadiSam system radical SAM enzyme [Bacteroidales bacterium]
MCIGAAGCGIYSPGIFPNTFTNLIGIGNGHLPEIDLNKWTIEAKYYVPTPKGLKCLLCPNECKIKTDEFGECHTRVNLDNRLYCIAYGNPCAVHIDPIEKKPLFHYLPGSRSYSIATAGCNLACLNCQNWEISQTGPDKTRNHDLMPDKVVEEAIKSDCKSIAYTYSDPVAFYEYAYDTAKIARENGIGNVLVSAGYILEEPLKEWCKYMDAANIDLKSFSNEIYEMLNAGKLEPVLNTLKTLADEGVWLEITNLVIPDWTDDMDMIKKMCNWLVENNFENYPLHFSRFHPLYKLTHLPATPVQVLENARKIAISEGLKFVYIGNVPGLESINTYCPECKTKIIERKGFNILNNKIEDSKCSNCGTFIAGRWK